MDHQLTKPEAITIAIEDIVDDVRRGRIRVPKFQRGFRWDAKDVERLLESIQLGYPIGSLLLWKRRAEAGIVEIGGLKIAAAEMADAYWVVDGQQRITSLANVLLESGDAVQGDRRFDWAFSLNQAKFVPRSRTSDSAVPLSILIRYDRLLKWIQPRKLSSDVLDRVFALARTIREYKIPAYVVTGDDEARLRDIFDRMNNYGRRLGRAEVFHALHGGSGEGMNSLRDVSDYIDNELGFGRVDEGTLVSAVMARRGPNVFREVRNEFRKESSQEGDLIDSVEDEKKVAYQGTADALAAAIKFLREDACVPHFGFLAYRYLLVVLVRYFGLFPEPQERSRILLRRWYWRAALLGPEPMKGWTQSERRFLSRIIADDEHRSAQDLLKLVEEFKSGRELGINEIDGAFKFTSARSKMILCALWGCKPRKASDTFEEYVIPDAEQTLLGQTTARLATLRINPDQSAPAGLVIALDGDNQETFGAHLAREDVSPLWLASHCITPDAATALRRGDWQEFLTKRSESLQTVVREFLIRQAEWEHEDTPPLSYLLSQFDEAEEVADA